MTEPEAEVDRVLRETGGSVSVLEAAERLDRDPRVVLEAARSLDVQGLAEFEAGFDGLPEGAPEEVVLDVHFEMIAAGEPLTVRELDERTVHGKLELLDALAALREYYEQLEPPAGEPDPDYEVLSPLDVKREPPTSGAGRPFSFADAYWLRRLAASEGCSPYARTKPPPFA